MATNRTIFSTDINGTTYKFAERSVREIESLIADEASAFDAKDILRLKGIHSAFIVKALSDATPEFTVEDFKDLGATTVNTLYSAILASQGVKLEAKTTVGERQAS